MTSINQITANLQRDWIHNESSQRQIQTEADFVILTYNILNEDLCPEKPGVSNDDSTNGQRHPLLMEEIDHHNDADIVCMQEVSCQYYDNTLLPAMQLRGFSGHYIKRPVDRAPGDGRPWTDGSATFYRDKRFKLIKKKEGHFRDLFAMGKEKLLINADSAGSYSKLIDSRRSYLFILFQCLDTNRLLAVGNVHLTFDFFKRMDMISLETAFAVNELFKFSGGLETAHILCGDFNQEPHHPGYQLLHNGSLNQAMETYLRTFDYHDKDTKQVRSLMVIFKECFTNPSGSLKSAYETVLRHEVPFSNYEDPTGYYKTPKRDCLSEAVQGLFDASPSHPKVYRTDPEAYGSEKYIAALDYIWFSSDTLQCESVLKMVDEELILPFHACPNSNFPSDHLPLKARFTYLKM